MRARICARAVRRYQRRRLLRRGRVQDDLRRALKARRKRRGHDGRLRPLQHRERARHGHARRVPCERTGDARPRGRNVPPKALRRRQDPRHSGKRRRPGLRARDAGLDELLGLYAVAV